MYPCSKTSDRSVDVSLPNSLCECRKNGLICSEMCLCMECDNVEQDKDLDDISSEIENCDTDDDDDA